MNRRTRRLDIQGYRGIAVLGVVLFHFDQELFFFGYLGVDIFFVISGYVITPYLEKIVESKRPIPSLLGFYEERIRRLNPLMGIVVIFTTVLFFLIGPLSEFRTLTGQALATLLYAGNIQAFTTSQGNYFNPNPNALLHTWSLSAEQQLYFMIPILFLLILSKKMNFVLRKYLVFFFFLYLIYFLSSINVIFGVVNPLYILPQLSYYLPVSRFWQFGFGAISYRASKEQVNSAQFTLILTMVGLLILTITQRTSEIICVLFSLLLFQSNLAKTNNVVWRPLIWLGNKSYSIYLFHLPILYFYNNSPYIIEMNELLKNILIFFTIMIVSWTGSKCFEHRWRKESRQKVPQFSQVVIFFSLIPLVILMFVRIGTINYFWLSEPPVLQGTLDCNIKGKFGECVYDTLSDNKKILLVGDSHAAAISQSFTRVARGLGLNPVIMSGRGCPIFSVDSNYLANNNIYQSPKNCQEFNSNVLRFLDQNPRTSVVVMQRNPLAIKTEVPQQVLDKVKNGLLQLSQKTDALVIMGFVPEFKRSQSQGTVWSLLKENESVPKFYMEDFENNSHEYLLNNISFDDVFFFDISKVLCDQHQCKFKHNDQYLYWDENHLSLAGAAYIENFMIFAIKSALRF